MPYTPKQCVVFALMSKGKKKGKPPKDWKGYCAHKAKKSK